MGLIKAALGAAGGTLADQWKEFFYCDAIDNDVLDVYKRQLLEYTIIFINFFHTFLISNNIKRQKKQ